MFLLRSKILQKMHTGNHTDEWVTLSVFFLIWKTSGRMGNIIYSKIWYTKIHRWVGDTLCIAKKDKSRWKRENVWGRVCLQTRSWYGRSLDEWVTVPLQKKLWYKKLHTWAGDSLCRSWYGRNLHEWITFYWNMWLRKLHRWVGGALCKSWYGRNLDEWVTLYAKNRIQEITQMIGWHFL